MKTKKLHNDGVWALLFLAPAVIGLCVFTIYPLFESLHISFTSWDLFSEKVFVGLQNYIDFFHDPTGIKVFINTIVFTLLAVPIQLVISFLSCSFKSENKRYSFLSRGIFSSLYCFHGINFNSMAMVIQY